MADLGFTDAQWDGFFDRLGIGTRAGRRLLELRDNWTREREQVREFDPNENTDAGGVTLAGVKWRTNTDADGKIYVRITGSGPYTVSLYKATGGGSGDKVAEGSGAADSEITLSEENSSGLSGTYDLAAAPTAETDDAHYLRPYLDYRLEGKRIFDGTDTEDEDTRSQQAWLSLCDRMRGYVDQMLGELDAFVLQMMQNYGAEFLESGETALIEETSQDDGSGSIDQLRRGLLVDLSHAMADETTGSTQAVARNVVAAAAGVASSRNDGLGAIASHTPDEHVPTPSRIEIKCVEGLGTGAGGAERFEVTLVDLSVTPNVRTTFSRRLTIKQPYKGELGVGTITLTRTLSKTGDGSNTELAAVSSGWSTTGENEDNTDEGVLYWKIVANGADWDIEFYSSSNRTSGSLVAKATNVATGAAFQATQQNASGLTVNGTVGSGPTDATEGTIDLNYHHVQNDNNVPDSYTISITKTTTGKGQTLLARLLGYSLNSATSGSETIEEGILAEANTFEPYSVRDN